MFNNKFSIDEQTVEPKKGRRSYIISGKELLDSGQFGRSIMVKKMVVVTEENRKSCDEEVKRFESCLNCKSPNIVQIVHSIYEEYDGNHYHYIAMERGMICLRKLLLKVENREGLSQEILLDFIQDSTDALCYLHEEGIGHSEIAAENIIVFKHYKDGGRNSDKLFKFSNFGVSRRDEISSVAVKLEDMLPIISERPTSSKSMGFKDRQKYEKDEIDLWFLGCLLFKCTTGKNPFPDPHEDNHAYKTCINGLDFENIWKDGTDLPPTQHSKWFRRVVKGLIRTMLHRGTIPNVLAIVNKLRTAPISTFIIVKPPEIIRRCTYADLSNIDELAVGYPMLSQEIDWVQEQNLEYYAISKREIKRFDNDFTLCHSQVYIILQKPNEDNVYGSISLTPEVLYGENQLDEKLYQAYKLTQETNDLIGICKKIVSILKTSLSRAASEYKTYNKHFIETKPNRIELMNILRANIMYGVLGYEGDLRKKFVDCYNKLVGCQLRQEILEDLAETIIMLTEEFKKIEVFIQKSNKNLHKNCLEEYYCAYIDVGKYTKEDQINQLHTESLTKRNGLRNKLVKVFNGADEKGRGGLLHCLLMAIFCHKILDDAIKYSKDSSEKNIDKILRSTMITFEKLIRDEQTKKICLLGPHSKETVDMSIRYYKIAKKSTQQQTIDDIHKTTTL